jgi:predicted nucleic acid-binding Zn ribbon protein
VRGKLCPVCSEPLPAPAKTGRPREYCSKVCTERARRRRKRAAGLLEYADIVEAHVGRPGFGSEAYLRGRAAELRAMATEAIRGLPA